MRVRYCNVRIAGGKRSGHLVVGVVGVLRVLLLHQAGERLVHEGHEPQVLQLYRLSELLVVLQNK